MKIGFCFLCFIFSMQCFGQYLIAIPILQKPFIYLYDANKDKRIRKIYPDEIIHINSSITLTNWCKASIYVDDTCFVKKEEIDIINNLPKAAQTNHIKRIFTKFKFFNNSSKRNYYYQRIFYPILSYFKEYYEFYKDPILIKDYFELIKCSPDGEFAETFHSTICHIYFVDKQLLLMQLKKIKNNKARNVSILKEAIDYYISLHKNTTNKTEEEVLKIKEIEWDYIDNFFNEKK